MACAAQVQIGPARQSFWALHLRGERGAARAHAPAAAPRRGRAERTAPASRWSAALAADGCGSRPRRGARPALERGTRASRRAARTDARQVWTRKQAGVPAHGTLALDGGARAAIEALAVIDDTAGYHARVTEWRWSAGVGRERGRRRAGLEPRQRRQRPADAAASARCGSPGARTRSPPVSFAADLTAIRCEDGSRAALSSAEAERSRRDNLLLARAATTARRSARSRGTLPGGVAAGARAAA